MMHKYLILYTWCLILLLIGFPAGNIKAQLSTVRAMGKTLSYGPEATEKEYYKTRKTLDLTGDSSSSPIEASKPSPVKQTNTGPSKKPPANIISFPLHTIQITSSWGDRTHPVTGRQQFHSGVDLKAEFEPVFAFATGVVKKVAYGEIEGLYVVVDHGGGVETTYAHLEAVHCEIGQIVRSGKQIAISGNSGRTTGPHLHFAIRKDGRTIRPTRFLMQ